MSVDEIINALAEPVLRRIGKLIADALEAGVRWIIDLVREHQHAAAVA